jgi:hypothetical protein
MIETLAALSLATSAGSSLLSFFGGNAAADAADASVDYNLAIDQQNAQLSKYSALYQTSIAKTQSEIAKIAAQSSYSLQMLNAGQMETDANRAIAEAEVNAKIRENDAAKIEFEAREGGRRMREENDRIMGATRAAYGKAGVVGSSGSPLVAMADSAGKLQLAVADMFYQADSERTAAFRDAALARYEGSTTATQLRNQASVTRYEAGFSLLDAAVETYNQKALDFQSSLVNMGYQGDLNTASMNASATRSQASAARTSSFGSLLAGASETAFAAYKMQPPKTP